MVTLRELCKEYEDSDSKSRCSELAGLIEDAVRAYLNKMYSNALNINNSTEGTIFNHTDYRDDRGCLTLDEVWDEKVYLNYTDSWSYGGSCHETFCVTFDDYEKFKEAQFVKELEDKKKCALNHKILSLRMEIMILEEELNKL